MNLSDQIFNNVISKTFDSPGRGRKQCPECKVYVGARTQYCKCGYEFSTKNTSLTVKEKREQENAATPEELMYCRSVAVGASGKIIYAGSGSCPVKLYNININDVYDFCENIIAYGISENKIYMPSAIKTWLGHQFGFNSQEYFDAIKFVDEWYEFKLENMEKYNNEKDEMFCDNV